MKSIINYYYNLFPTEFKNRFGGFLFVIQDLKYLLVEVKETLQKTEEIYNLLIKNQIGNFIIVPNRFGEFYSEHDGQTYLLFRIRCLPEEMMSFKETINIPAAGDNIWSKLWGERIDYYEVQINELGQEKKIILQSVNYYIGLAENAIAIATKVEEDLTKFDYAIQHYRMKVPIKRGDYFNPGNMLIDLNVRDLAEYVKESFFNNSKEPDDYIGYLLSLSLDQKKANLLLARLLYPTYYFDLFDEIILGEKNEEELIPIIKATKRFEYFLKELYKHLAIKYQIVNIEWLKKGTIVPH